MGILKMEQELPQIGRYQLEEFLGGGMSHVYRARDTTIGRIVAVKILTPEGYQDAEVRERFLHEARMAGNITHPNVVRVYDYGDADGKPYLVMEFLQGQSLKALIQSGQLSDTRQKVTVALQLARALEYVHLHGVIHRDIKPDNVHVTPDRVVKLMDFGIAKQEGFSRTRAGLLIGSPYYMSPEQVRGVAITTSTDVYGFGMLLFELFSGHKPFTATTIEEILNKILNEQIDMSPPRQAGAPEPLIGLIARCTAKDPEARPRNFTEIAAALEAVLSPEAVVRPPQAASEQPLQPASSRPSWILPVAALAVVAIVATVGVIMYQGSAPTPPTSSNQPTGQAPANPPSTAAAPEGMVLIPEGAFLFGEKKESRSLPAYFVDKAEVTVRAFREFGAATGQSLPFGNVEDDLPVVNVTIEEARKFAVWARKRLPTSLEWEKCARGVDGRRFPWGDQSDASKANLKDNPAASGKPWPAEASSPDVSAHGVLNLGGNVSELIDSRVTPSELALKGFAFLTPPAVADEPWFMARGASFQMPVISATTWEWGSVPARFRSPSIGFRCVKDLP